MATPAAGAAILTKYDCIFFKAEFNLLTRVGVVAEAPYIVEKTIQKDTIQKKRIQPFYDLLSHISPSHLFIFIFSYKLISFPSDIKHIASKVFKICVKNSSLYLFCILSLSE